MRIARYTLIAVVLSLGAVYALAGDDFPPVNPQELAMKQDASNPTGSAVILYRESNTNNIENVKSEYYRVKIFSEAGKKYADVEIPYDKEVFNVYDVKARTIRPDGSIVPFNGKVFDKVLAKRGGLNVQAKAFSLPNVEPGCILEYRYKVGWDRQYWVPPRWIVQDELPTLHAKFVTTNPRGVEVAYTWFLPAGYPSPHNTGQSTELELSNIPAFEHEEYSLPDDALKMRVLFYEAPSSGVKEADFWRDKGKDLYKKAEDFSQPRKGVVQEVQRLVQPSDPPEVKLHKLYVRTQQIRNLTYERAKTEAEEKREKLKDADNAEQVLEHGYGYRNQINSTFVAMARAAGLEAYVVYVTERDDDIFEPKLLDTSQLRWRLAVVKLGNEERYFDPGTPGCPFGLVPWEDILVRGVRPSKEGAQYIMTPVPQAGASERDRTGEFTLADDGSLHGHLAIRYTGLFALGERLRALRKDEVERRKQLEEDIRSWLPAETQVKLDKVSGWEDSEQPLQVDATLDVPNMSTAAGTRIILPADVFDMNRKNPFEHETRNGLIFFDYPYTTTDAFTLHLPAAWKVETLPPPRDVNAGVARYQVTRTQAGSDLHVQRQYHMDGVSFEAKYYPALRNFYSQIGAADEEQVILRAGPPN
jgi:hypothetical protein